MKKIIVLTVLTGVTILIGTILAVFAYACQSFTCLVLSLFTFLMSAYYATNLDDATRNGGKDR